MQGFVLGQKTIWVGLAGIIIKWTALKKPEAAIINSHLYLQFLSF